jgi:predicted O-methyltransferase YrrM
VKKTLLMYSSIRLAKKYLHYYFTAHNGKGHGMHSPFVFQFILHVLNNKSNYQPPLEIEEIRKHLLQDTRILQIEDLGAGSRITTTKERSVQQLAKSALKPKKYAQLLFRLAKHYQSKNIIELGTSLGITTSYLSAANPEASITTIEGSKAVAEIAKENFNKLQLKNIQLLQGNFDDVLSSAIHHLPFVNLAYIDGNHRYEPTINYFNQILPKTNNDSILVFDDIHWSAEMEKAWQEIKSHPSVKCTVDIFFLGFVFFRDEFKTKQHFTIRF